jgi:HAD superfamily hydrolase (TIGR01509 family)
METKSVLFDLGGVYYSEGFHDGLFAIAARLDLDQDHFFDAAVGAVFSTGYVTGMVPEKTFWDTLAKNTGVKENLYPLRKLILDSFKPMDGMAELVREVRSVVPVALLTDQTNWLYDLDQRDDLLFEFDQIVSSYEEGFSKRDPEIFRIACQRLDIFPEEGLFFDDNSDNVDRAREFGLQAVVFEGADAAREVLMEAGVFSSGETVPPVTSD